MKFHALEQVNLFWTSGDSLAFLDHSRQVTLCFYGTPTISEFLVVDKFSRFFEAGKDIPLTHQLKWWIEGVNMRD